MGHYYADLACSKCGCLVCACPVIKPAPKKPQWIIDRTLWVAQRYEMPSHAMALNFSDSMVKKYDTKEEAEADIPELIRIKRDELRAEADMLDMMLTITPGKTNICPKCFEVPTECFCNGGYR